MPNGTVTPLQLTAGAGLLTNTGLSLGRDLTVKLAAYNNTAVISAWQAAVNYAAGWAGPTTFANMLTIGASTCAALGNSIPAGAPTPRPISGPVNTGFSGLIADTGNYYLGSGNSAVFAQAFSAAQGFCASSNEFINSAVNAATYLGPTFAGMDALASNSITSASKNLEKYGVDLGRQGQLTNLADIENYGTPAALLRQISKVGGLQGGTLEIIKTPLLSAGLTEESIATLLSGNRADDPTLFDNYQRLAYNGMLMLTGDDLQQILDILDVTTPGIENLADLLDPKKIFPNSWKCLTTTTPVGVVPIYQPDGSVGSTLSNDVANYIPTVTGCDELGKIIPQENAVANKAIQVALQQITGITNSSLPKLSQAVLGQVQNIWNVTRPYLEDSVVNNGADIPTFYRAQQDIPAGIDINNTDYWQPTTLGGISTMSGLPDIQAQAAPITDATSAVYQSMATGTGPNGSITISDVLGAADGYLYNDYLGTVTAEINNLNGLGALTALTATYVAMLSATTDPALQTLINQANSQIASIVSIYPAITTTINTAWSAMATKLNSEYNYQQQAQIIWSDIPTQSQGSVLALTKSLPSISSDTAPGGAAWFFDQVSDISTPGGQAIVGSMREAQNNQRLGAAQLGLDTKPNPAPNIMPSPVVTPVNKGLC